MIAASRRESVLRSPVAVKMRPPRKLPTTTILVPNAVNHILFSTRIQRSQRCMEKGIVVLERQISRMFSSDGVCFSKSEMEAFFPGVRKSNSLYSIAIRIAVRLTRTRCMFTDQEPVLLYNRVIARLSSQLLLRK